MLPNFVIIGVQKAGTTTLCAALNEHPQIYTAPEKEVYYLLHRSELRQGPRLV